MLQRGDLVPHFDVTTVHGVRVAYSAIWQRRNLVLVILPSAASETSMHDISQLDGLAAECAGRDTECVVTRDVVAGTRAPAAIVADRWGEIVYAAVGGLDGGTLPLVDDLLEWVTFLQHRCPECEGEAR
jgi:hypothetical protein